MVPFKNSKARQGFVLEGPPSSESHGSCWTILLLSVCVTWWSYVYLARPPETRKLLFCSYIIVIQAVLVYLGKIEAEICHTHVHTDNGKFCFSFLWSTGPTSSVPRMYKTHPQKLNILVLFVIHVNFDRVCVCVCGHYPVTLRIIVLTWIFIDNPICQY